MFPFFRYCTHPDASNTCFYQACTGHPNKSTTGNIYICITFICFPFSRTFNPQTTFYPTSNVTLHTIIYNKQCGYNSLFCKKKSFFDLIFKIKYYNSSKILFINIFSFGNLPPHLILESLF